MTPPPAICVVGSTNIDLTFRTARLPKAGETLAGHGFQLGYGGKGANQAVMAARLGPASRWSARSAATSSARAPSAIIANRASTPRTSASIPDRPTGVASIVVDDAARNCILVVPGANLGLTPEDVAPRPTPSAPPGAALSTGGALETVAEA